MEQQHAWFELDRYKYAWVTPKCLQGRNGHQRCHPNDETVSMDVDPSVFTRVNRAYTDEDKHCYMEQGLCFKCGKKGHQARQCPDRKEQPFKSTQHPKKGTFTPRPSKQSFKQRSYPTKRTQGFRKSNKPKGYFNMNARVASIEEVSSDEEDNEDEEIPFLAACTAQLSEEQRETLLEEIQDINANF